VTVPCTVVPLTTVGAERVNVDSTGSTVTIEVDRFPFTSAPIVTAVDPLTGFVETGKVT
jgi:hypothetical protein